MKVYDRVWGSSCLHLKVMYTSTSRFLTSDADHNAHAVII